MNCNEKYTDCIGKYKLDIYLMCRDRLEYLHESLNSVIIAAHKKARIIISDNSTGDDVGVYILENFKQVKYVRRTPPLDVIDHHNIILNEADAQYIVMFHDDDVMSEIYVDRMLNIIEDDKSLAAVGCNAEIIKDEIKTNKKFIKKTEGSITFSDRYKFIEYYLRISRFGPAPFPSYIYRMSLVKGQSMRKNQGGKYSDSSFLAGLLELGSIKWTLNPLMNYRVHGGNGSKFMSLKDRLSWFRWLNSINEIKLSGLVRKYKISFYYEWYKNKKNNSPYILPKSWKERIIFKFLLIEILKELIRNPEVFIILVSKIKRKIELYGK